MQAARPTQQRPLPAPPLAAAAAQLRAGPAPGLARVLGMPIGVAQPLTARLVSHESQAGVLQRPAPGQLWAMGQVRALTNMY
jgi:hypothetical protein